MEIVWEIAAFAGKTLILTAAVIAVLVVIANIAVRLRPPKEQLEVEYRNDDFEAYSDAIQEVTLDHKALKALHKSKKKAEKNRRQEILKRPRLFVLNFTGDIQASAVEHLREEITAVIASATAGDEAVLQLESTGGMVHTYGLAAAQLLRLRARGISLTICVDKVAASGGYLMACTADRILASPFAILGSIGVIAAVPNFHRILKKHDIDYEEVTAGEFKRTVSLLGEITERGKQKFVEQVEDTHRLFKDFVQQQRPKVDLERVSTGEYWFGKRALDLGLIDEIKSSDDYIYSHKDTSQILKLSLKKRKSLGEKLAENFSLSAERLLGKWWQNVHDETVLRR